jgi:hypothetical protein
MTSAKPVRHSRGRTAEKYAERNEEPKARTNLESGKRQEAQPRLDLPLRDEARARRRMSPEAPPIPGEGKRASNNGGGGPGPWHLATSKALPVGSATSTSARSSISIWQV